MMSYRYSAPDLVTLADSLLVASGLEPEKAAAVAEILVEGDLLGQTTHGLALLVPYLADLERGGMGKNGNPEIIADFPAAITWNGRRLPGPWLVLRALGIAVERARQAGTCTVVIQRSHHIACLAAYLKRVADQGMMVLLTCSDPTVATVAPHGGRRGVFTPNPFAAAWPTASGPVMLDISMSITTNGMVKRRHIEKRRMDGKWLVDVDGHPTDNPGVLFTAPAGAILPLGGIDNGHKGYALGLMVEALANGLAGHGRANPSEGWSAGVFIQVLNPALFGGAQNFLRETSHLAEICRMTLPRPGFTSVRLPGEGGLMRRSKQLSEGVTLYPGIMDAIAPWAERLGVGLPASRD
jgi:L-lactate dehydrogenase